MTKKYSPWGKIQKETVYAEGLVFVSTASHGGYHVSVSKLKEMPEELRKRSLAYCPKNWFEEDCEASLVIAAFPLVFGFEKAAAALESVRKMRSNGYSL